MKNVVAPCGILGTIVIIKFDLARFKVSFFSDIGKQLCDFVSTGLSLQSPAVEWKTILLVGMIQIWD